jgi:hypothetical protein
MNGTKRLMIALGMLGIPLAACDEATPREIDVTPAQEQAMCDVLASNPSTGPVPKQAAEQIADAPNLSAAGTKQPVELTDFQGAQGGYLELTIDPANEAPVFLLLDATVPFAVVREDGSTVSFFEEAQESELCDEAGGRYSWFVEKSTNYLVFGPTDQTSLNLVLETVD